jgi:hypothetical protein
MCVIIKITEQNNVDFCLLLSTQDKYNQLPYEPIEGFFFL